MIRSSRFRVRGSGFEGLQGPGSRTQDSGFKTQGLIFDSVTTGTGVIFATSALTQEDSCGGEWHGVEESRQLLVAALHFRVPIQMAVPPVHEQHLVQRKGMGLHLHTAPATPCPAIETSVSKPA